MRRAIITTALGLSLVIPSAAMAWRDRGYDDYYDREQAIQMQRIANEMKRQNDYNAYRDEKAEYDRMLESKPEYLRPMIKHYNPGPQPPK